MLRFTSLTVEDFGPFKGSQTIDFTDSDGVTFIWGNNGRGKTTLLNVFRYALYGKFQSRRGAIVDLTGLSNIESHDEGRYGFKVVLRMICDDKRYDLTRQFKLRNGISKPTKNDDYEEIVFLKEGSSILSREATEHILKLIMPEQVARFFLFDGELLQEYEELLLEETEVGAKIKDSIETILGVPVLTNGATDTNSVLDEYRKNKTSIAQSNVQTQKIASQMAALDEEKLQHALELERLNEDLKQEWSTRSRLEGELQQSEHVKSLLNDMKSFEGDIEEKKARRESLLSQIVVETKDAWKGLFNTRIESILADIDVELRELENKDNSHKIAKHFLNDMRFAVHERHCQLCDQDINDDLIVKILKKIKNAESEYGGLSSEEATSLSSLRSRQVTLKSMQTPSRKDTLDVLEREYSKVDVEITDTFRKLKTVREELERHGDIDELSSHMQTQIRELSQSLKRIENLEDGCREERQKIDSAKNALLTLEGRLDKMATDTDMLIVKRKVALCEQIHMIFEEGIDAYRDKLKGDVARDATDLFLQISNDPDYVELKINENYGLSILHTSGDTVPLRSAGFEHVVALSLIGALHKNAPLRGPIIMDSPFGRLDPTHKENITKTLPNMSEQIVLLAYTHEIDEQRARHTLGATLKKEYRLARQTSRYTRIEPLMD